MQVMIFFKRGTNTNWWTN